MIGALLVPTVFLLLALVVGLAVLSVLRTECMRGMGLRPMLGLSRTTYPTARGAAGPVRPFFAAPPPSHWQGAARRVVKHSAEPRSKAPAQAWPFSSLINTPAAGAPRPSSLTVDGGYSVKDQKDLCRN